MILDLSCSKPRVFFALNNVVILESDLIRNLTLSLLPFFIIRVNCLPRMTIFVRIDVSIVDRTTNRNDERFS